MGSLWQRSNAMEFDNNGSIAVAAKAYFYDAGSTTPKPVYQDAAETTVRTQPVTADGNGRWPAVFVPFGSYKVETTTSAGSAIGSTIDSIPNPEPFDEEVAVDPDSQYSTGHPSWGFGDETRSGWVRLNGRTIGNAASTATERANADTEDLFAHFYNRMSDTLAPVSGGRGANAAADYAANKRITVPDLRAAGIRGLDTMGNTAASLLGSAPVVAGSTILPGSTLGANTQALSTANLPSHTHTGTSASSGAHTHTATTTTDGSHTHSGTTGVESASHTHAYTSPLVGANNPSVGAGATTVATPTANGGTSGTQSANHTHDITTGSSGSHNHTLTTTSDGAHTHTFTTDATGSGTAHNNVGRDVLVTFYAKL